MNELENSRLSKQIFEHGYRLTADVENEYGPGIVDSTMKFQKNLASVSLDHMFITDDRPDQWKVPKGRLFGLIESNLNATMHIDASQMTDDESVAKAELHTSHSSFNRAMHGSPFHSKIRYPRGFSAPDETQEGLIEAKAELFFDVSVDDFVEMRSFQMAAAGDVLLPKSKLEYAYDLAGKCMTDVFAELPERQNQGRAMFKLSDGETGYMLYYRDDPVSSLLDGHSNHPRPSFAFVVTEKKPVYNGDGLPGAANSATLSFNDMSRRTDILSVINRKNEQGRSISVPNTSSEAVDELLKLLEEVSQSTDRVILQSNTRRSLDFSYDIDKEFTPPIQTTFSTKDYIARQLGR